MKVSEVLLRRATRANVRIITAVFDYLDELESRGVIPRPLPMKGDSADMDPEMPDPPATVPMEPTRARLYSCVSASFNKSGVYVPGPAKLALIEDLIVQFGLGLVPPAAIPPLIEAIRGTIKAGLAGQHVVLTASSAPQYAAWFGATPMDRKNGEEALAWLDASIAQHGVSR